MLFQRPVDWLFIFPLMITTRTKRRTDGLSTFIGLSLGRRFEERYRHLISALETQQNRSFFLDMVGVYVSFAVSKCFFHCASSRNPSSKVCLIRLAPPALPGGENDVKKLGGAKFFFG